MALTRLKGAAPSDDNPLDVAMYWKDILDNHLEEAIGCSIAEFKNKRECAGRKDKIAKIARGVGIAGSVAAAALFLGGLIALPFNPGVFLGITIAGYAVEFVVITSYVLLAHRWFKAIATLQDLTDVVRLLYELIGICLNAFSTAHAYMQTEAGEDIVKRLNADFSNDGQQINKILILKMIREFSLSESTLSAMEERSRASLDKYKKHSRKELGQNIWSFGVNKLFEYENILFPSRMKPIALLLEDDSKDLLKIMALLRFREETPCDSNPLDVAMYWKDILDNHLEEAIGCSIADVKSKSEYVGRTEKFVNIARGVGIAGPVTGTVMYLCAFIALHFTPGAGVDLLRAAYVVHMVAITTNYALYICGRVEGEVARHDLDGYRKLMYELIEICLNAFSKAHAYLQTKAGEDSAKRLKAQLGNDCQQNNDGKNLILKMIKEFSLCESTFSTMEERSRASLEKYMKCSCKEQGQNICSSLNKLVEDKDGLFPSRMKQIALLLEDDPKVLQKITALSWFKGTAPSDGNPLDVAMYWKDILDNHLKQAVGCSIAEFKGTSEVNVSLLRECASHMVKIVRYESIANVASNAGYLAGLALILCGALGFPFPSAAGFGLEIAGSAVFVAASVVKAGGIKLDFDKMRTIEAADVAFQDLTEIMKMLYKFFEMCLNAFSTAHAYLQTKEGEDSVKRLNTHLSNDAEQNKDGKKITLKMMREFSSNESTSSTMEERTRASLEKYKKHSCNKWGSFHQVKDGHLPSRMRQIAHLLEDGSKDFLKVHSDFTQ